MNKISITGITIALLCAGASAQYTDMPRTNINYKTVTLTNVAFRSQTSDSYGGAIYIYESTVTIHNALFETNSATDGGGAICLQGVSPSLTVSNATFTGNSASFGGAVRVSSGSATLTDVSFFYNTSTGSGGALNGSASLVTLNVSAGKTSTFLGNRGATASNGNGTYINNAGILMVNTAAGATLDMQDSIAVQNSTVTKNGAGVWKVGQTNTLTSTAMFTVNEGELFMYANAVMNSGDFSFVSNSVLTLNINSRMNPTFFTITSNATVNFDGGRLTAATLNLPANFKFTIDDRRYAIGDLIIGFNTLTGFADGYALAAYINGKTTEIDVSCYTVAGQKGIYVGSIPDVTVYFVPQNGDKVTVTTQRVDGVYSLPTQPVRDGYTFGGWFTGTNGTGTAITGSTTVTAPEPVHVYAHWLEQTGEFRWIKILGYLGTSANVTVPPTIAGLPVMEIGASAFALGTDNATYIRSMVLSSSVTTLGVSSFENSLLTNLVIEGTVAAIPAAAFQNCAGLKSFDFSDVTTIGGAAFTGTAIPYIIFRNNAPVLTGDLFEVAKTVYYLPPHHTSWDAFKGWHANTRMLTDTINTDSLADTTAGFSFDIDSNIAVGDTVKMNIIIETKDLLTDADWTTFATNIPPAPFVDATAAAFPHRFYRARMDRDSIQ